MTYPGQLSFLLLCMSLYHVQDQMEWRVAAELDHWRCRVYIQSYINTRLEALSLHVCLLYILLSSMSIE